MTYIKLSTTEAYETAFIAFFSFLVEGHCHELNLK